LLLTTEALISEIPTAESAAEPAHAGGGGGMGGMF
jgi:hypothetical protein